MVSDPRFTNPIQNGGGRIAIYRGSPGDQAHLCPTTPNSAGPGVHLFAEGPISLRNNSLNLTVDGGPGPVTGFFVYGTPEPPTPFGDGTLCVKCPCHTAGFLTLDGGGAGLLPLDLWSPPFSNGPGAIAAGDTVAFQFLYPDPAAGTRNASDSIVIRFVP